MQNTTLVKNDTATALRKRAKKVVVVMPAYNAARTLEVTYRGIDSKLVDDIVLVDDHSKDATVEIARKLGVRVLVHPQNRGYGGNQKTCYREALKLKADIVVMLHPDGQYEPSLMSKLVLPIADNQADVVLGSRMMAGSQALAGGMPFYKYVANKLLTAMENKVLRQHLSEYHTGYRAFSRSFLSTLPLHANSDGYVFDTEVLVQAIHFKARILEVSVPTRYFDGASSATFADSTVYGLKTLLTLGKYLLHRCGIRRNALFTPLAEWHEQQPR